MCAEILLLELGTAKKRFRQSLPILWQLKASPSHSELAKGPMRIPIAGLPMAMVCCYLNT